MPTRDRREGRKVVTALFADIVGSTALGERLDPEDYRQVIGDAVATMVTAVEQYGGEIRDLAGDGVLALFGAGVSHEDDPERAALAALEVIDGISRYAERVSLDWQIDDFSVRVGLETGLVVLGLVGGGGAIQFGAMGDTLNTAARLQSAAEPGTVVLGPVTHGLIEPLFEWGESSSLTLKGKAEPVRAHRLLCRRANAPTRSSSHQAGTRLVGRDDELELGREAIADVRAGKGRIIVVTGEAGIGKTRIVAELRAEFTDGGADGAPWLEGHGVSYAAAEPYLPFRQALRPTVEAQGAKASALARLVVGLPLSAEDTAQLEALSQEALQRGVLDAVSSVLDERRGGEPIALVLDDLHWADASSLRLAAGLMEATEDLPLLLVLVMRPEQEHEAWELRGSALSEHSERSREISLTSLDSASERMLVADRVGAGTLPAELESELLARSEGNPFYLEELVRTLLDTGALVRAGDDWRFDREVAIELPDTVERVIMARLDRLEPASRDFLSAASVLGRRFWLAVLERLAGRKLPPEELDHLEALALIEMATLALEYQFTHPLIQQTAYNGLLKRRRSELHGRAAAAIEEMNDPVTPEHFPALARHHSAAGNAADAVRYHALAGGSALRVFALDEAIRHFDAALALVPSLESDSALRLLPELRLNRGRTHARLGNYTASIDDLRAALAGAEEIGDRALEMSALTDLGVSVRGTGYELAIDCQERALRVAEELGDLETQVLALSRLSLVESNRLRLDRALELGDRAMAIARGLGEDAVVTTALDAAKLVAFQLGDLERLEATTSEMIEIQRRVDDPFFLQWALTEAAAVPLARGRHEEALELIDQAGAANRRIRDRLSGAMILEARSWVERSRGDYGSAIEAIREASRIVTGMDVAEWTGWIEASHGSHLLELRAAPLAVPVLERAVAGAEVAGTANRLLRATSQLAWGYCLLESGEAAQDALTRAKGLLGQVSTPPGAAFLNGYEAYLAIARTHLFLDDSDQAERVLRPLLDAAQTVGWHQIVAHASGLYGCACRARGADEEARIAFGSAIEAAERGSTPGAAWEAHAELAEFHASRGETFDSKRHAVKAQSILGRLVAAVKTEDLRQGLSEVKRSLG
ncbi:MAG: AAA family ATPase [Actinomycetota bacterium]|nr:AAA family ATPase [Actinomycetota bacterium]